MARPVSWPDKITAPPKAMEFYRLIAELQRSDAFKECHPFDGALIHGTPHVRWEATTTSLPRMICGFLGIPYRQRLCHTNNCMNPFHYVDFPKVSGFASPDTLPVAIIEPPQLKEYIELIEYYIDENDLKEVTFQTLRPLIPPEDMDDETLTESLKELTK